MRRRFVLGGTLVAVVVASFALWHASFTHARHANRGVYVPIVTAASFNNATITAACDAPSSNVSLGLTKPTVIDRFDGVDAVIFATKTRYSACIVFGPKNVAENQPTIFTPVKKGVVELESFGSANPNPGHSTWSTDTWFVMRVSPTVDLVRALTNGPSQVSKIGDGFAFIHEKESAVVLGKRAYGVAVGFGAGGYVVGTTSLG